MHQTKIQSQNRERVMPVRYPALQWSKPQIGYHIQIAGWCRRLPPLAWRDCRCVCPSHTSPYERRIRIWSDDLI